MLGAFGRNVGVFNGAFIHAGTPAATSPGHKSSVAAYDAVCTRCSPRVSSTSSSGSVIPSLSGNGRTGSLANAASVGCSVLAWLPVESRYQEAAGGLLRSLGPLGVQGSCEDFVEFVCSRRSENRFFRM